MYIVYRTWHFYINKKSISGPYKITKYQDNKLINLKTSFEKRSQRNLSWMENLTTLKIDEKIWIYNYKKYIGELKFIIHQDWFDSEGWNDIATEMHHNIKGR